MVIADSVALFYSMLALLCNCATFPCSKMKGSDTIVTGSATDVHVLQYMDLSLLAVGHECHHTNVQP